MKKTLALSALLAVASLGFACGGLHLAGGFRLPGHALQGGGASLAETIRGAQDGQARSDASAHGPAGKRRALGIHGAVHQDQRTHRHAQQTQDLHHAHGITVSFKCKVASCFHLAAG